MYNWTANAKIIRREGSFPALIGKENQGSQQHISCASTKWLGWCQELCLCLVFMRGIWTVLGAVQCFLPGALKVFMFGTEAALLFFLMMLFFMCVNSDLGGSGGGGGGGAGFALTSV